MGQSSLCCQHTHTHAHTHKAVQSWQAQQDRPFFLFIIYSPTQHTLASTSYRENIYSQHSSISLTKLFSTSKHSLFTMQRSGHIGSISPFGCRRVAVRDQILLRGDIDVTGYGHAWRILCMNEEDGGLYFTVWPLKVLIWLQRTTYGCSQTGHLAAIYVFYQTKSDKFDIETCKFISKIHSRLRIYCTVKTLNKNQLTKANNFFISIYIYVIVTKFFKKQKTLSALFSNGTSHKQLNLHLHVSVS